MQAINLIRQRDRLNARQLHLDLCLCERRNLAQEDELDFVCEELDLIEDKLDRIRQDEQIERDHQTFVNKLYQIAEDGERSHQRRVNELYAEIQDEIQESREWTDELFASSEEARRKGPYAPIYFPLYY